MIRIMSLPLAIGTLVAESNKNHFTQSSNRTGSSPSAPVLSFQTHSTNPPYSSSASSCSYQNDKQAKPGNRPKSNALVEIGQKLISNHVLLFSGTFWGIIDISLFDGRSLQIGKHFVRIGQGLIELLTLEVLSKTIKNLSYDGMFLAQDSNRAPPECVYFYTKHSVLQVHLLGCLYLNDINND
jgi:hypothetical protein